MFWKAGRFYPGALDDRRSSEQSPRFFPHRAAFVKGGPSRGSGVGGAFRITGAQREARFFPLPLVGRNDREAGKQLTCVPTLISRRARCLPAPSPKSPLSSRTKNTLGFFCEILLSCSNGGSSESGELLCYQCRANCSSISLLQRSPPLTRLSNKFV